MAEPLKTFFSPDLVSRIAAGVAAAHPPFADGAFCRDASAGLDELELMDRAKHIARTLAAHLPEDYPAALEILLRSLGPEHASDELVGAGMAPFFYLPHVLFVAERGLAHFDLSMRAQRALTKRFTAEGSVRPYIEADPERAFAYFVEWSSDEDPHVRRLVSEGTRMRLPWAPRVAWLDANPRRVIELLERLRDDPASLVRRSVANNLNDLGKLYPDLLVETCRAWLDGAGAERRALVEHALRSAIKRGESGALALLGFGAEASVAIEGAGCVPEVVAIGDRARVGFTLCSTSRRPQSLLVDLRVDFVKANGSSSPKVFKLKRVELAPGERVTLSKSVSLAVHTTRRPYPGWHAVHALVNGAPLPAGGFEVVEAG